MIRQLEASSIGLNYRILKLHVGTGAVIFDLVGGKVSWEEIVT
jgi:hypothetical protein